MKSFAILLILFNVLTASAQKLPKVQEKNLLAPSQIKVDGKPQEWGGKYEAFNPATSFYYSIANDSENLYLIIHITDPVIINKTISAGISFIVSPNIGNESSKPKITITYPVFDPANKPMVDVKNTPKIKVNEPSTILQADSFMNDNNKRLKDKSKFLRVAGITGLDTMLSVYNRDGIKAAQLFDNQMSYTYELSVSLKHLGISPLKGEKFNYEIKSNGSKMTNINGVIFATPKPGSRFGAMTITKAAMHPSTIPVMTTDTYFSGEYILTK